MTIVLGFLEFDEFNDRDSQSVNPVGEASQSSKTFGLDIDPYVYDTATLHVGKFDGITAPQRAVKDAVLADIMPLLANLRTLAPSGTMLTNVKAILEVGGILVVNAVAATVILNPKDSKQYPASISFSYVKDGAVNWDFQIWLADASYRQEYMGVHYRVLPPLANMDLVYNNFGQARVEIQNNSSLESVATRTATFNGNSVYTSTSVIYMTLVNPSNANDFISAPFIILNNGLAGINYADQVTAIMDAVIDDSTHSGGDWEDVIPETRPTTRWLFIPDYENVAIVNGGVSHMSSATPLSIDRSTTLVNKYWPSIVADKTLPTTLEYAAYLPMLYLSAGLYGICDPGSVSGFVKFKDEFPQYMTFDVNNPAIAMLEPNTRTLIQRMDGALRYANMYVPGMVMPAGYSVETFDGRQYVKVGTDRMIVLVMTKASFLA